MGPLAGKSHCAWDGEIGMKKRPVFKFCLDLSRDLFVFLSLYKLFCFISISAVFIFLDIHVFNQIFPIMVNPCSPSIPTIQGAEFVAGAG